MSRRITTVIITIAVIITMAGAGGYFAFQYFTGARYTAENGLTSSIKFVGVARELFGFSRPMSYLLVLQNSDEMRPTGGFIGSYGIVQFDQGQIANFFTDDVYNLDRLAPAHTRPEAPEPIARYLEQPRWYLRDANWDPDFPTSAQRILEFYREELQAVQHVAPDQLTTYNLQLTTPLDGVIAITPEAIRPLLKIVGPLTVKDQTFTAENLTDTLEFEVQIRFEERGIHRPQRKAIISELGRLLIGKVQKIPPQQLPEIIQNVRNALDERHILLYATDPDLQKRIADLGWDGRVLNSEGDYLSVIDANMFALKTDPYIQRSIIYSVSQTPAGLFGEVAITYAYPQSGPAWKTKGYRAFTRVYVPNGSILSSASGAMQEESLSEPGQITISQEHDKTVFGAFLAVQAQETKTLRLRYRLPDEIRAQLDKGSYELLIQKQSGTVGHNLTVKVDFGKVPKAWSPTGLGAALEGTRLSWQGSLRRDQQFRIKF